MTKTRAMITAVTNRHEATINTITVAAIPVAAVVSVTAVSGDGVNGPSHAFSVVGRGNGGCVASCLGISLVLKGHNSDDRSRSFIDLGTTAMPSGHGSNAEQSAGRWR
jgi:hypothetical protein